MRKFWRKLSPQQVFLLFLPLAFVFAVVVLLVSSRSFLSKQTCGCGPLPQNPTGEFNSVEKKALYDNREVSYPIAQLAPGPVKQALLGEMVLGETADERWVEIDLSDQKLYARQNDRIVYEFLISSGKPWTPTVRGEFRVWSKLRYSKMSGGSRAMGNYYYLPNVPYIQYFYRDYGLHGAYWHQNFGQQMSHGCVNLAILDAEKLFYWTTPVIPPGKGVVYASKDDPGTKVVIHE